MERNGYLGILLNCILTTMEQKVKVFQWQIRASGLLILPSLMTGHILDAVDSQFVCRAGTCFPDVLEHIRCAVQCVYILVSSLGERMLRLCYEHVNHGLI